MFWSEEDYAFMAASENEPLYLLPHVLKIGKIERVGNKFDKKDLCMENNMFEDIVAEGNIVVIDNDWIVLCKRWRPEFHNLFCYLYLHKEAKNLMVGSHFTMTEDKKKSIRLATNEERLMLFEEMFKYGIAFDKHDHHLIGKLVSV